MKKEMFLVLVLIMQICLVNAGFNLSENNSYEITKNYEKGETIKGWVNISFENVSVNSLLSGFNESVSVIEFLSENDYDCSYSDKCNCSPRDCREGYISDSGENSMNFFLNERNTKEIGLRVEGNISAISSVSFKIDSNAGKTCLNPLKIDFLSNGNYEWRYEEVSDDSGCFIEDKNGCFDSIYSSETTQMVSGFKYCETIEVPPLKAFEIGAFVEGDANARFEMTISAEENSNCAIPNVEAGGEISCIAEFDNALTSFQEAEVCIEIIEGENYSIDYEDNAPVCGSTISEDTSSSGKDFNVFAKPVKYDSINSVININSSSIGDNEEYLGELLSSYIESEYYGECNPYCIIPIKISSGINQDITLSDLSLKYVNFNQQTSNKFYEIEKKSASLKSKFLKLDLEKAGFKTPYEEGEHDLELKLNQEEIFKETINVESFDYDILGIYPNEVSVLMQRKFYLLFDENNESFTYKWDFGDNQTKITTYDPFASHIYSEIGNYNVNVEISNSDENFSESFYVNAIAPYESINNTLKEYKNNLDILKTKINKLPQWIKEEVLEVFELEYIQTKVSELEKNYKSTFSSDESELIEIMEDLIALNIPKDFRISNEIKNSPLFPNENEIELEILDELGAGNPEKTVSEYNTEINAWMRENLEASLNSKTYSFIYSDESKENIFTLVDIELKPLKDIDKEFYFIVNINPMDIILNVDHKTKDFDEKALAFRFYEMLENKNIEFLYPGTFQLNNHPFYFSPEFNELGVVIKPGICNYNGKCEGEENYKNCRNDCKPWGWVLFWLIVLIIIFIGAYIGLQEWYKKKYEKHLFKNKSQLFNLINFMNNSFRQGLTKKQIFDKLLKKGWTKEQLNYAWKKFKGERTGIWEIPIFKWLENKKVKKELEKRGAKLFQKPNFSKK